jgi:hypothetical protein
LELRDTRIRTSSLLGVASFAMVAVQLKGYGERYPASLLYAL